MPNIDLTTLPGWASLSDGSHNITIVAKADGYRDSEPSAAVSVEKAAEADALVGTWVLNEDIEYYSLLGAEYHKNVEINVSGTFYGCEIVSSNPSQYGQTNLTRIKINGPYDGTNGSKNYPKGRLLFFNDNKKYTASDGSEIILQTRWLRGGELAGYATECQMYAVSVKEKKYSFINVKDDPYKTRARSFTISSIGDNSTEDLSMFLTWLQANATKQS